MGKILTILIIVASIATVASYVVYENIQIKKSFNLKKEKALKIINVEIEKRERLNAKMERLAVEFNAEYKNNLNDNLLVLKSKIEKAKNEKELMDIINN